jgi:outer membrane protein assembly factor BamE
MLAIASLCLNACSVYDSTTRKIANGITPYRIDIIQGQAITKEQLAQVKIGMAKEDVQFTLGSPSVNSIFSADTWNYVFFYRKGFNDVVKKRQVTLKFSGNTLQNIEADDLPSELELIKEIDKHK